MWKPRSAQVLALSLAVGATVSGCQAPGPAPQEAHLAPTWLERIEGDWVAKAWGGAFFVSYHSTTPGALFSVGNLVDGDVVNFFEFEVFAQTDAGWTMQPYPMGKPEAVFSLVSPASEAAVWVFENPENDFPTRIEYEVSQPDHLSIRLSDPFHASQQVEEFHFERVHENR